jgi:hypothetical protein
VDKTVAGAGIGAAIGGFGSITLGLVVAAIPGIGPVVALDPLSVALTAAVGGGFVGGLVGFFAAHGVPDHDAAGTPSACGPARTSWPCTPTTGCAPRWC